jgi:hypothetical protein
VAQLKPKMLESASETPTTPATIETPAASTTPTIAPGGALSPQLQQQPQTISTMMIVASSLLAIVLVLQLYILVELRGVKEALRIGSCPAALSASSFSRTASTVTAAATSDAGSL